MTGAAATPDVFPCPVFEGSEKRISVTFAAAAGASTPPPPAGLRTLTRTQLDAMLDLAACQIVSSRSNEHFDAYVLSESSCFVYPGEWVCAAGWVGGVSKGCVADCVCMGGWLGE